MNGEQLGLGCTKLVQQSIDGEGGVCRSSDSTKPVRSPGGDGELDVVGSEEGDTVVVADVAAGLHDVGEAVSASPDLFEMVAPALSLSISNGAVSGRTGPLGC